MKLLFKDKVMKFWYFPLILFLIYLQLKPVNEGTVEVILLDSQTTEHNYRSEGNIDTSIEGNDDTFTEAIISQTNKSKAVNNKNANLVKPSVVYKQTDKGLVKLDMTNPTVCLAVSAFLESANQDTEGQQLQIESTLLRVGVWGGNDTICSTVLNSKKVGDLVKQHHCHFSWYCDGLGDKVIPNDPKSNKVWKELKVMAKQTIPKWERGEIDHNLTHYCALSVEKKTWWVKYMKPESRTVRHDHVFYEHDPDAFNKAWSRKLALNKVNNTGS